MKSKPLCLKCRKPFPSTGIGNRLCRLCNRGNRNDMSSRMARIGSGCVGENRQRGGRDLGNV